MRPADYGRTQPSRRMRLRVPASERSLSRQQLAEAVGVHYQTIGYIERGDYTPSLELVLRLARYFDLPVEALFSLDPFARLDADALAGRQASQGRV